MYKKYKQSFVVFLFLFLVANCQAHLFSLATSSPRDIYTVKLAERTGLPGEQHRYVTELTLFKSGYLLAQERFFSAHNGFEKRDGERFPRHKWLSENLLWLGQKDILPALNPDMITVDIRTSTPLSYFMINGKNEVFLLLDLQSSTKVELQAYPQFGENVEFSWLGYAGRFINGTGIVSGGKNFRIRTKDIEQVHYQITVKDDSVVIRSKDANVLE
jgi:hypothetical protein